MAKRFLVNIDLGKNEIQNVVIHKLATAPAGPIEGQIYYNTSDKRYYLRQASTWKDVTGRLDDILTTTNAITITDNGDGTMSINIANANGSNAGLQSTAHFNDLNNATSAGTANTLVKRDGNGDATFNKINLTNGTITAAPVANTDIANKAYVDSVVTSGMTIVGNINCSANPDYPAAVVGEAYHVSAAGRIGGGSGELVEVGDMILCTADNAGGSEALVGTAWIVLQANVDAATETVAGTIRIATTGEVTAGTDDATAVTPAKLAAYVATLIGAEKYATDIGNASLTSIAVAHGLATSDVVVSVRDTTSKELVECDVVVTDANTVTLGFTTAPALNALRVTIQG